MALPEGTQLAGELLDVDPSDGGRTGLAWGGTRSIREPEPAVAGPSELGTGLCVCGTQPADISLSHRRRNPFLRNNGTPWTCHGVPLSILFLTPAVAD